MTQLMKGKRGLVMGVANDHSIAWGIAKTLADHGAELAFTFQGEALGRRVKPLAESVGSKIVMPCDVEDVDSVDAVFAELKAKWGAMDFLVHAIGFSDKNELKGRYADTTRKNFERTMVISCFSFTEAAKRAAELMPNGGSMITLTYNGGDRAMPNYNVMGLAKAALESSVRYLAVDFGGQNIRVNAISAGPIRTSPAPASTTRAICSRSSSAIRRSAAGCPWKTSAAPDFICSPNCPAASPVKFTSSTPATTSSLCRSPTCCATRPTRPRTPRSRRRPFRDGAAQCCAVGRSGQSNL